jgi:hypothetical protein
MGLFDYVHVKPDDARFVCSEGHSLSGQEFQSKDFGCTMGDVTIIGNQIVLEDGGYGDSPKHPLLGRFYVYCSCHQCPVFVQANSGNLCDVECTFEIEVVDDVIRSVKRVSASTADWLASEPQREWMKNCHGPMPHGEAWAIRKRIWDERDQPTQKGRP